MIDGRFVIGVLWGLDLVKEERHLFGLCSRTQWEEIMDPLALHLPKVPRQTFVEWVGETIPLSFWAKAFDERQRAKDSSHNAAIRALAFKWIRILWRCWTDRQPYDETRYLLTLQKRHSPVVA
jgi:hypothetical protein